MMIAFLGFAVWIGAFAFWVGCAVWVERRAARRRRQGFNQLERAR